MPPPFPHGKDFLKNWLLRLLLTYTTATKTFMQVRRNDTMNKLTSDAMHMP